MRKHTTRISIFRTGLVFSFVALVLSVGPAATQASNASGDLEARVKTLEDQIRALQTSSVVLLPAGIVGGPADDAGKTFCPAGSYVAGVQAWKSSSATKYCVGCLTGIQLICKPFLP